MAAGFTSNSSRRRRRSDKEKKADENVFGGSRTSVKVSSKINYVALERLLSEGAPISSDGNGVSFSTLPAAFSPQINHEDEADEEEGETESEDQEDTEDPYDGGHAKHAKHAGEAREAEDEEDEEAADASAWTQRRQVVDYSVMDEGFEDYYE